MLCTMAIRFSKVRGSAEFEPPASVIGTPAKLGFGWMSTQFWKAVAPPGRRR